MICKDCPEPKQVEKDYVTWERDFINRENSLLARDLSENPEDYVVSMNMWEINQLTDIQPKDAVWIKSSCEPFCDEMELDEEKQGLSTIKFLSCDDEGFTTEVAVKDAVTGRFKTEQVKIPPITIISSTTRIYLDPQYTRRNWIFNPDESIEQTEKVLDWKANKEQENNEIALGIKKYTNAEFSREALSQVVKELKQCKVIIPFPNTLKTLLDPKVLRVRGDYDKILSFVKLYCFLNQTKLPSHKTKDALIVIATSEICVEALRIVEQPIASMASHLEKRTRKLLEALKQLLITRGGQPIEKHHRDNLAAIMGKSDRTIRSLLGEMETAGYMSSDGRKPMRYMLLCNIDEIETKIKCFSAKLESADYLMENMTKESQITLRSLSENGNEWIGEEYKRYCNKEEAKEEESNDGIEFRVIPSEDTTIKKKEDKNN